MPKRPALHPPLDLRGLLDAVRLMERGLDAGAALDMGLTNKSFDPYEQTLVRDLIRARIPKNWKGRSCLQTDIKMQEYDGGGAAGPQHDMDCGKGPLLPAGIHGL